MILEQIYGKGCMTMILKQIYGPSNAPPGRDYERDKSFLKSFKELFATWLVKDPKKRPSSQKTFKCRFLNMHVPPNILVALFSMALLH